MFDPRTGRRGRLLWPPLALAGFAALAACGSSEGDTAAAAETPQDRGAFVQCMTENGVDIPEGGMRITEPGGDRPPMQDGAATRGARPPAPDGVDPEAWEAALKTCGHLGSRRTAAPTEGGS
jgi:hypothetical protein